MPVIHVRLTEAQHALLQQTADYENLPLATMARILAVAGAEIHLRQTEASLSGLTPTRQTNQIAAKPRSNVVSFHPAPKPGRTTKG